MFFKSKKYMLKPRTHIKNGRKNYKALKKFHVEALNLTFKIIKLNST